MVSPHVSPSEAVSPRSGYMASPPSIGGHSNSMAVTAS